MSISNIIADYLFKEGVASEALRLEDEADTFIAAIGPLAIPPIASPFGRREQQTFPLYKKAATTPDQQGVVGGFEEPESESYDTVTIEDLPENLTSLFGITGREGKVDVFGRSYQIGPEPVKGTFGVTQTFNPGYALGQFASLASPVSPSFVGEKNREQLEYIQAMAGLGKQGYGIGLVNGQVVGVTPSHIVGTVPNASPEDMEKIRNTLTGKSGPMKAGVEAFKNIRPETPVTSPMRKFQDEVIKATGIPDSLKSQILGFDYDRSKFQNIMAFRGETRSPDEIKKNLGYRDLITGKDFLKDYRDARDLGAGDDRDDQIDEQTFIDTTATPKGPDTYFSDMPTGGFFTDSDDSYDSGTGDATGGFGGSSEGDFGFTAYGGKIGMSNGGFASKTATVKGVGLIKPEQTFVDTDVVDDDIEFPAENGDYIINGPASNEKEKEIKLLVNYGIDELKKEGVDIRVGNPKIKGKDKVPLIVASSETYIPRVIAEKIGYPILDALNNTGKPEVARLKRKLNDEPSDESKYKASEGTLVKKPTTGSFMTMEEANKALGVKSEPINPKTLKLFKSYNKKFKPQRGDVEKLLDNMNDKDKLALLIATETISTKDPFETLESVGQVVINRINDKQFPDFKNVNTLDEVLKQRSSRGTGTKMFQFDGLEPTSVKNRINEFLNKGGMRGYKRALMAAENVLTKGGGEPDYMTDRMPFNVLFYDKAGSPTSISRRYKDGKDIGPNELIDEYGKVGDHTFYTLHMTKEYP